MDVCACSCSCAQGIPAASSIHRPAPNAVASPPAFMKETEVLVQMVKAKERNGRDQGEDASPCPRQSAPPAAHSDGGLQVDQSLFACRVPCSC